MGSLRVMNRQKKAKAKTLANLRNYLIIKSIFFLIPQDV